MAAFSCSFGLRSGIAIGLAATLPMLGCGGGSGSDCKGGEVQVCYTGTAATRGVGACHDGEQTCTDGAWAECLGEQLPTVEVCNEIDDDCNGTADDDPQISAEVCDGVDNDCNGTTDDIADPIADPSFEGGSPNASWAEESTNFGTPLCTAAGCGTGGTGTGPRTGTWWAWFGGIGASYEHGSLEQSVVIPAGAGTLRFYFEVPVCSDAGASDTFGVWMDGTELYHVDATDARCDVQAYAPVDLDISAYADGESHTLTLDSTSIGNGVTNFWVDDLSIACGTPAVGLPPSPLAAPRPGSAGSVAASARWPGHERF